MKAAAAGVVAPLSSNPVPFEALTAGRRGGRAASAGPPSGTTATGIGVPAAADAAALAVATTGTAVRIRVASRGVGPAWAPAVARARVADSSATPSHDQRLVVILTVHEGSSSSSTSCALVGVPAVPGVSVLADGHHDSFTLAEVKNACRDSPGSSVPIDVGSTSAAGSGSDDTI